MTPVIKEPKLPDSGMRLAMLLTALDQCDNEFALEREDYRTRRKVLENQLHSLKMDIITGQKSLLDVCESVAEAMDGMVIETPGGTKGTVSVVRPKGGADV